MALHFFCCCALPAVTVLFIRGVYKHGSAQSIDIKLCKGLIFQDPRLQTRYAFKLRLIYPLFPYILAFSAFLQLSSTAAAHKAAAPPHFRSGRCPRWWPPPYISGLTLSPFSYTKSVPFGAVDYAAINNKIRSHFYVRLFPNPCGVR